MPTGILRLLPQQNKRFQNMQKTLMEKMENVRQLKIRTQVSDNLQDLIFNHFVEKSLSDINVASLCTYRGGGVLEKYGFLEQLRWTTDVVFDHSILIWHVATDICYGLDADKIDSSYNKENSKQLADYLLYLLVICPFMLPIGMGMIRFQDTCSEAVEFFRKEEKTFKSDGGNREFCTKKKSMELRTKLLSFKDNIWDKSVLFEASKLAKYLQEEMSDKEKKWKMVSNVWVEMLGYAANQCRGFYHSEKLAEGGELITHVWLLMAHLGISERYQE